MCFPIFYSTVETKGFRDPIISTKNKEKQKTKKGSPLIGLGQNVGIVTCLRRKVSEFFASGSVYMYYDYRHIIIFFKIFYG